MSVRTRITATALLTGLSLAAACENPTQSTGSGGAPAPAPTQPPAVASVQITPGSLTLLSQGGHRQLQATPLASGGQALEGREVTWTSSDLTIATVDPSGNVTAHQPGQAWITAAVAGRTAQARVDVVPVTVDSVALAAAWIEVHAGAAKYLGATLYAADGRVLPWHPVTWSTSDTSVATVDGNGYIRGVAGGRAWITATSGSGTARAEVIVPLEKVMTLADAGGRGLPAEVSDVIHDDGEGALRRVRVVATEGRLTFHTREETYEQRVVLRVYERRGVRAADGSITWNLHETVEERVVTDRGLVQRNVYTGTPIFQSTLLPELRYYAENASQFGLSVWQALPGTGIILPWLYRL